MKKYIIGLAVLVALFAGVSVASAEDMGVDLGTKVQYFHFMDNAFDDAGNADMVYVGLTAYKELFAPNLYFGLESGWAGRSKDIAGTDTELDVSYVPIEFNAKYVVPFGCKNEFAWYTGAGLSYSYINFDTKGFDESDWVFGGQLFTGLNYNITKQLYVGVEAKYQMTQDIKLDGHDTGVSADNFRTGINLGWKF